MREIEFHNFVMGRLESLKGKGFKVLIFDTWTRFEIPFISGSAEINKIQTILFSQWHLQSHGDMEGFF